MPEIVRLPTRMDCDGLDVMHPADRMPPKTFPVLTNARVVEEGRLESRPGYTPYDTGTRVHSMRRLNDPDDSFSPTGYTNVVGDGNLLRAGPQGSLATVDMGYSGYPLSLLTFRPDQSPETWMYVYDLNKQAKVRPDGVVQPIGLPPPNYGSEMTYGPPAMVDADTGQVLGGWTHGGSAAAPTLQDRASDMSGATGLTISQILYDSGTTGWCVIVPVAGTPASISPGAMGNRMKVVLNSGGGNQENALVREVHPSIGTSAIAGIAYDNGNSGPCVIVLTAQPSGGDYQALSRNSVVQLGGGEYVRVLSVILSPDGATYAFRCSTAASHFASETVQGVLSWYCYTTGTHAAGETITSKWISSVIASGTQGFIFVTPVTTPNLSVAASRPIDVANDWMHLSFNVSAAVNLAFLEVRIFVGAVGSGDYYSWTFTADQFSDGWNEILVPLSQATRVSPHTGESLTNVNGLELVANINAPLTFGFDWWFLFGTYGPTIQPNSPVGMSYVVTNRNSGTGAASVPSPPIRYQLFPLREQVLITPKANSLTYQANAYIDKLDIWRMGGAITNFTYVGTVSNLPLAPATYADNLPDPSIAASPQADFTLIQPWPLLALPRLGVINVVGTKVKWVSGNYFDLTLLSGSVILINGVAFQTYGQSKVGTDLELFGNAGVLTNATYQIASPTLAAQPLPFAFGPLEGPLSPVAFALGDLVNAGTLYYSNSSNLDAASDQNTVEIAPPGEPLVSGAVWNGIVFVGSRENVYITRYSYLQTLGIPGQTTFQFNRIPCPSGGMWSRWSVCSGADGVYFLGRDGIYRATEQGAVSITDHRLYPLFPHDGQPGQTSYGLLPINMSNLSALRLSAADEDVYFDYSTASGAS